MRRKKNQCNNNIEEEPLVEKIEYKVLGLTVEEAEDFFKKEDINYRLDKEVWGENESSYIPRITRVKRADNVFLITYSYFKPGKGVLQHGIQNN